MMRHEPLNGEERRADRRIHGSGCTALISWRPVFKSVRHPPEPGFRVVVHRLWASSSRHRFARHVPPGASTFYAIRKENIDWSKLGACKEEGLTI